jgi:hypothetical protein
LTGRPARTAASAWSRAIGTVTAADLASARDSYASRLPLPRHHHTEKEPVRFLRHAMCPTTKSTKTITIISSILIPIPPGARNCSEEASGLLRPADGGRSSCPNEASLLRGDFRST